MGNRIFIAVAAFLAMTGLAACQSPEPISQFPDLRFGHKGAIGLDVGSVETVVLYEAPMKEPNVEHLMPVSPEQAARNWAEDRLRAVGSNDYSVRFVIVDASTVMEKIKTQQGVTGFFTNDQAEKYTSRLEISVELRDARRMVVAEAKASGWNSRTVAEDASLADREELWFSMVEKLMTEIDNQLVSSMRQHMGQVMR